MAAVGGTVHAIRLCQGEFQVAKNGVSRKGRYGGWVSAAAALRPEAERFCPIILSPEGEVGAASWGHLREGPHEGVVGRGFILREIYEERTGI